MPAADWATGLFWGENGIRTHESLNRTIYFPSKPHKPLEHFSICTKGGIRTHTPFRDRFLRPARATISPLWHFFVALLGFEPRTFLMFSNGFKPSNFAYLFIERLYQRWESNPHPFQDRFLRPASLPVSSLWYLWRDEDPTPTRFNETQFSRLEGAPCTNLTLLVEYVEGLEPPMSFDTALQAVVFATQTTHTFVPEEGLEPSRPCDQGILSPSCATNFITLAFSV